jgi:hypothetical protein
MISGRLRLYTQPLFAVAFLALTWFYFAGITDIMNGFMAAVTGKTAVLECLWSKNSEEAWEWGDQAEISGLLEKASDEAHVTFIGRSVLVLGGSTSRDLASYFLRMVLPPQQRNEISKRWLESGREGYALFPSTGKRAKDFKDMYNSALMNPLLNAGWEFEQVKGPAAGCRDCHSSFSNLDYVAFLRGGAFNHSDGITYEFSWKPEIFTRADVTAFQTRYCKKDYDVVHIGKGLHDAAFKSLDELTTEKLRQRFLSLAELVKCFPEKTLIVLRTPYLSTRNPPKEENGNINTTIVLKELVGTGAFGPSRSVLIDGHFLTTGPNHPHPFDGHHYKSPVSMAYLSLLSYETKLFFQGGFLDKKARKSQHCGLGVSLETQDGHSASTAR